MNQHEDRILHGIYYHREMINEPVEVTGSEVLWLEGHSFRDSAQWHKDGKFQALTSPPHSKDKGFDPFGADHERPLRYLNEKGLIHFESLIHNSKVRIWATSAGADRARRLHTWIGRRGLWYRDNKDGAVGLLVAALVAIVVTLITNLIVHAVGHH